ncbi:hypothetical protein MEQU1_000787 [Malassezia equina]|uniref:TRAF-type domain-containing protein n=1 Tax=Malassezia equina TaxID=1381935 RepID=A0AAF0EAZ9_9BASI|nr:hypothetical protein MEQU1_000787 [Malassezia equina]
MRYRDAPPLLHAMVDSLRVRCPEEGCDYECERQSMRAHQQQQHATTTSRLVCAYCTEDMSVDEWEAHQDVCDAMPVACGDACDWHGPRSMQDAHRAQCAYVKLGPYLREQQAKWEAAKRENEALKWRLDQMEQELRSTRAQADDCAYSLGKWLCTPSWTPGEVPALENTLSGLRRTLSAMNEAAHMSQQASENARALAMRTSIDMSAIADELASLWQTLAPASKKEGEPLSGASGAPRFPRGPSLPLRPGALRARGWEMKL